MGEVIYLRPEYKPLSPFDAALVLKAECDELRHEFRQPNSLVTAEDVEIAEKILIDALGELSNAQLQTAVRMMTESSNDGAA